MPVFLIPIVAGGWYYYRNMKQKVRGEPLQESSAISEAPDLASSSIEVSLLGQTLSNDETETQDLKTIPEEVTCDDGNAGAVVVNNSPLLQRSDTTHTDASEEDGDEEQYRGILGATCGSCDPGEVFEIVHCSPRGLEETIFW